MLLSYFKGSLRIGEVIRYTIIYTPSRDSVLPTPSVFYLRIKNTCAIALRAAYMRGPYNLYVAAYPATYHPNEEFMDAHMLGVPKFEPNLKPGGSWECELKIPDNIRTQSPNSNANKTGDVSWIIEISSQIIFSDSATVNYELFLGRDRNCQVNGHPNNNGSKNGKILAPVNKIHSRALKVSVENTFTLWNKPSFIELDEKEKNSGETETSEIDFIARSTKNQEKSETSRQKKPRAKKIHLVVLTHGLHSNLGADMLYLKESIDATAKQTKLNARERRGKLKANYAKDSSRPDNDSRNSQTKQWINDHGMSRSSEDQKRRLDNSDSSEDEEVVVRGFSGNAARTERGIKYLGKRLARYVLGVTYPDQPFHPSAKEKISPILLFGAKTNNHQASEGDAYSQHDNDKRRTYQITSISFIAHSLGGLVQMYAIGYVQKHSPVFFEKIKPINFIALASPFLGLSNENPLYVKFALDFGLVGRTGQDLGLTWRAPTIARGSWSAIVGAISDNTTVQDKQENPPETKPLLQILPTSPAHVALKKFKNRTVYSNVVNDGIVPLRTSCLLFLDWQGLGRVEKAQRESGLVKQVAEWGWAEITGANTTIKIDHSILKSTAKANHDVPEPDNFTAKDKSDSTVPLPRSQTVIVTNDHSSIPPIVTKFMKLFSPSDLPANSNHETKKKNYERSQINSSFFETLQSSTSIGIATQRDNFHSSLPPKTSIFESAGDLLKPPLPSTEFLLNISSRPQTIFHDRIYKSSDIPPPYSKEKDIKKTSFKDNSRSDLTDSSTSSEYLGNTEKFLDIDDSHKGRSISPNNSRASQHKPTMDAEEKIARAYHRDVSWRKVLVQLKPDAHNNMIVRRMFSNAYGWPVIKHLCDTHFSDAVITETKDVSFT